MLLRPDNSLGAATVIARYPDMNHHGANVRAVLDDPLNIVLEAPGNNFSVFEYSLPYVYTGHYYFETVRGKEAVRISKEMLYEIFNRYGAKVIRGLTPVDNRAAVWMSRHIGFTDTGIVDSIVDGPCHVFTLGYADFQRKQ